MQLRFISGILFAGLFPRTLPAQIPVVNAVENNYSFIAPGLPNYGVAEGSIFVIFGSNLATSPTGLQSAPLNSTLNGVSVNVTSGGTTKAALLYYVTPSQIGAILPSSVPVGTGQITVTNNGATSTPAPITVVQSAFGILTLNNGSGPAAAFDFKFNYLGASNAVNPGETILLWGTGAGPVPNDNQQSAVTAPIEVDVGGVAAKVTYAGRSQYPGLDQINLVVPSGVSGCYVSVVVRSGNMVSNFSSIPVAASGRTCSDVTTGLGFSMGQLQALAGKTTATIGGFDLVKIAANIPATSLTPASTSVIDSGGASFAKITLPAQFDPYSVLAASNTVASVGSCTVYSLSASTASSSSGSSAPPVSTVPTVTSVNLNAGPFVNVTGPNGAKAMPYQNGAYGAQLGGGAGPSALPVFIPAAGGTFTFDNGTGGPDLGPFKSSLTFNPVVWTNMASLSTIQRSQNLTVLWTGGDPNTYVSISGSSSSSVGTQYVFGLFNCIAAATAHQFTVPASVLLALPPTGSITVGTISVPLYGALGVMSYAEEATLTIPGVDLAYALAYSLATAVPIYQ